MNENTKRIELTITTDYVPKWGLVEACREVFQNALDAEKLDPLNEMVFEYYPGEGALSIGNKLSELSTKSLLFGGTSKKDSTELIGQFGEGYKLALLVFARLGKPVTIFNFKQNTTWTPVLRESSTFDGAEVLAIDIHEMPEDVTMANPSDVSTEWHIKDISLDEWQELQMFNLHLRDEVEVLYKLEGVGEILVGEGEQSEVFVNGLFVQSLHEKLRYGYNLDPSVVTLDRDRNSLKLSDVENATATLWHSALSTQPAAIDTYVYGGGSLGPMARLCIDMLLEPDPISDVWLLDSLVCSPTADSYAAEKVHNMLYFWYKKEAKGAHITHNGRHGLVPPTEQPGETLEVGLVMHRLLSYNKVLNLSVVTKPAAPAGAGENWKMDRLEQFALDFSEELGDDAFKELQEIISDLKQ